MLKLPTIGEAGTDESGAGSLFGSLFVAAVIFNDDIKNIMETNRKVVIKDSKKLTEKQRRNVVDFIKHHSTWSVIEIKPAEIDELNILRARLKGFHDALDNLSKRPKKILVDGNKFLPYGEIPHECIPRGDQTHLSIAAASILAKCAQVDHINNHCANDETLKLWDIKNNKGYGTARHMEMIRKNGASPYHRKTFSPVKNFV